MAKMWKANFDDFNRVDVDYYWLQWTMNIKDDSEIVTYNNEIGTGPNSSEFWRVLKVT